MPASARGFTLIELLVVIVILAILGVTGTVLFMNVQKGARDAKRKADVEALYTAFENKFVGAGGYIDVTDSDFATDKIPSDPNSSRGNYFRIVANDKSGFKVCASLDANPSNQCNSQAANCYCKISTQSSISNTQSSNLSGDPSSILLGYGYSGSAPSCDTNGTLTSGLAGWWRMDESSWNGTPSQVIDSSGNGRNGTSANSATTAPGILGNAGSFNGTQYSSTGKFTLGGPTTLTASAWVNFSSISGTQIFFSQWGNTENIVWILQYGGGNISFNLRHDNTISGQNISFPFTPTLNTWYHIVGVFDANDKIYIYSNGDLKNSAPSTISSIVNLNTQVGIGAGRIGNPFSFSSAKVDDARIYTRALSASEIANLYNGGAGCAP